MTDAVHWLPNLVGNVSIWKLAVDLNDTRFFDGRLLVPETEGSDRLPASVTWNVEGLLPLAGALERYGDETAAAVRDFAACVDRVRTELSDPASPYAKYKDAFSVPALDASSGAYFYSVTEKKLYVTNWGASPRAIAGREQKVFGYDAFGSFVDQAQSVGAAAPAQTAIPAIAASAAAPVAVAAVADSAKDEKAKDEKKKEDKEEKTKRDERKGQPWWVWLFVGLAVIAIALLVAWLLRDCDRHKLDLDAGDGAASVLDGSAATDASVDGAAASADSGLDAAGASDGGGDAGALADAGDGGDALDAGVVHRLADGGLVRVLPDGGLAHGRDGKVIFVVHGKGGGGSGGGSGSGGSAGGSGKGSGGGGGQGGDDDGERALRTHFHPEATHWRVVSGKGNLDPDSAVEGDGQSFEITLRPGKTDEGVKVQYQDAGGKWHPF